MERMLVVVFDTEKQAYEGLQSLNKLDSEGSIAVYSESVVQKNADGAIATKQAEGDFPIRTLSGTALGSLIGLLGGPVGVAAGAATGFLAGILGDAYVAGVDEDFLRDVSVRLTPGKFAVIADINEEWVTPVDSTMEGLGGVVFRSAKASVEADQWARHIAEINGDLEQLEAEHTRAQAERKAKIQAKIDDLKKKLNAAVAEAKARAEAIREENDAKLDSLRQKAQSANREKKAIIDARIAEIREHHEQQQAKLRSAIAGKLRKAAEKLEKAG